MGEAGSLGISRVGPRISLADENQIWCLSTGSVRERPREGTIASACTSVWEKTAFSALTLMPDNSVPLLISAVSFDTTAAALGLELRASESR